MSRVIPSPFVRLTLVLVSPSSRSPSASPRSPQIQPTSALLPSARHKLAPPSLLSAACHASRARHLVHRPSLATIHLTVSCLWTYSLPFCMFYFSFLVLDSSLFLLASLSPPLPSDFDFRRSFRPRASILHSFAAFNLNTGLSFCMRRRAVCCRQDSPFRL